MRERIRAALERVAQSAPVESAWLRTLSLLEYTGARKISRTAAAHHPSLEVLQHWSDETRHAALFQGLAVELNGGESPAYLCGEEAKTYFHGLDLALSAWAEAEAHAPGPDPLRDYLLVTSVIERRAMVLYPLYRAATRSVRVRDEVAKVIVEEQSHRQAIEARCRARIAGETPDWDFAEPMALEEALFDRFWSALEQRVFLERGLERGLATPATEARPR